MRRSDRTASPSTGVPVCLWASAALLALAWLVVLLVLRLGSGDPRLALAVMVASSFVIAGCALKARAPQRLAVFAVSGGIVVALLTGLILSGNWYWYAAQGANAAGDPSSAYVLLLSQQARGGESCFRFPRRGDAPGVRLCRSGIIVCSDTMLHLEIGRALAALNRDEEALAEYDKAIDLAAAEGYGGDTLELVWIEIHTARQRLGPK